MSALDKSRLTEDAARRLTERIRIAAVNYAEVKEKLIQLVYEAKEGGAHEVLGYKSWTAYLSEVLGDEPLRLARDDRQDMVKVLSAEGMSTRAIAPIVGSSHMQVGRDLRATGTNVPVDEPRISHGMDGKTRVHQPRPDSAPEPPVTPEPPAEESKPRGEAVTAQFTAAVVELNRVLNRFHRISESPNFPHNKNQVATLHGSDLARAISELQDLADALN